MAILSNIFCMVLDACVAGLVIAGILIVVKKVSGERMSAAWHYYIWLILLIRLVVPFLPQSRLSLFNIVRLPFQQQYEAESRMNLFDISLPGTAGDETVSVTGINDSVTDNRTQYNSTVGNNATTGNESRTTTGKTAEEMTTAENNVGTEPGKPRHKAPDALEVSSIIWVAGAALFLAYTSGMNIHIRKSIKKCPVCTDTEFLDILAECKSSLGLRKRTTPYICDRFGAPCIYGLTRPRLLVPDYVVHGMSRMEKRHILLHELMHLRRKDLIINNILIVLKSIYWFNPVFWYCFSKIRRDCEISCDEMVLRRMEKRERIKYGRTILEMSSCYPEKGFEYLAMGMVNRKSDIRKRIRQIINFKRPSAIWVAVAISIAAIICAAVLTNGAISPGPDPGTHIDNSELRQNFEKIYEEIEAGYSKDDTKEKFDEEYDYIISQEFDAFEFLMEQTKGDITVRRKAAAEWLMSDIIKLQSGEEFANYRQEYGVSAVKSDCSGLMGPGEEFEEWCALEKNTVVKITGRLNTDWYTAKKIEPMSEKSIHETDYTKMSMESDQVEFWINRKDIYYIYRDAPLSFGSTSMNDAEEYTHMIKSGIEERYYPMMDEITACIPVRLTPDEDGGIAGYALENDMIRIKRDQFNNSGIIRSGDWVLVEKVPYYWEQSDTGWIKEEYLVEIAEGMQPRQGFILRNTKIYKEPKTDSEVLNDTHIDIGELDHIPIACIHITEKSNAWYRVNAGINSFTGWVREQDVHFGITDEMKRIIYNPEPDFDLFMSRLKNEIRTNPSFVLKAIDTGVSLQADGEQRELLAESISSINGYEVFDGGIIPSREAVYPFYTLDFGTYSLAVTVENGLLVLMDIDTAYDYGIGRLGAPIRFITPNTEFIQKIREALPATPNTSKDSINYLMNAEKLTIGGDYSNDHEYTGQVRINKCTRAIKDAMGEEISQGSADTNIGEKSTFCFTFEDGTEITVTHTDKYIEFNDRYYKSLVLPKHLMGSMFAGYF